MALMWFICRVNRKRKILLWCCGPHSDAYEARKSAMARCVRSYVVNQSDQCSHLSNRSLSTSPAPNSPGNNSITEHHVAIALGEEDLTSDLQYHVKLLALLSCCNLGPKLQAVYPTNDILYALLDSSTILPVKLALGRLLIEAIKINPDKVEKLVRRIVRSLNMCFYSLLFFFLKKSYILKSVTILGLLGGDRKYIWVSATEIYGASCRLHLFWELR